MITHLTGTIHHKEGSFLSVDVQGVGYGVWVASPTLFSQGVACTLHIASHWNQEQGSTLYGFAEPLERSIFQSITACSGLGPKIALALIGNLGSHALLEALQTGNITALSSVSGVGAKKAEQMVMQLKGKVDKLIATSPAGSAPHGLARWKHVAEALSSLNYSRTEVDNAITHLRQQHPDTELSFDVLIRHALAHLAKRI